MRTVDLRIALEEAGASLSIVDRKLVITEPPHGLPPDLRRELRHGEAALTTLVILYPCHACKRGQEPFAGRCEPCPKRPATWRAIRQHREHSPTRGAR